MLECLRAVRPQTRRAPCRRGSQRSPTRTCACYGAGMRGYFQSELSSWTGGCSRELLILVARTWAHREGTWRPRINALQDVGEDSWLKVGGLTRSMRQLNGQRKCKELFPGPFPRIMIARTTASLLNS